MNDTLRSEAPIKSYRGAIARFLNSTEIDTRLLGMLGALTLIWVGFHFYGVIFNNFGAFLTPRSYVAFRCRLVPAFTNTIFKLFRLVGAHACSDASCGAFRFIVSTCAEVSQSAIVALVWYLFLLC